MRVVIAGGHGKIALLLERALAERGDAAVGLVRNADHVADVRGTGADAVLCDLERTTVDDLAAVLAGAHAVVFAAGAGAGCGFSRKGPRRPASAGTSKSPRWASTRPGRPAPTTCSARTSSRRRRPRRICGRGRWTGRSCAPAGSPTIRRPAPCGWRATSTAAR